MDLPTVALATVHLPNGLNLVGADWERKQRELAAFITNLFAAPAVAGTTEPGAKRPGVTLSITGRWRLDAEAEEGTQATSSSGVTTKADLVSTLPPSERPLPGSVLPVAEGSGLPDCDCFTPAVLFDPDDASPIPYPRRFQIELGASKIHGKGVFARKRFVESEVVEVCPVLEIHSRYVGGILEDYVFCGDRKGWRCAVLGYGMMYNSWIQANLSYYRDEEGNFVYVAARDIEKGEELLIDYGDDWWQSRDKPSAEAALLNWDRDGKAPTAAVKGAETKGKGPQAPSRAPKPLRTKSAKPKAKEGPQPRKPRRQLPVLEAERGPKP